MTQISSFIVYTNFLLKICLPLVSGGPTALGAPPEWSTPPLWEARSSSTKPWTTHSYEVVDRFAPNLIPGSSDVTQFCPKYFALSLNEKRNFWVYLVSAIVKYESAFNPTTRYRETTMGIDPITGEQVYSEGLLQLSYQDKLAYPFCDEFDWSRDRLLSRTDPTKTIFDPFKNLRCGIRILNWQVRRFNKIAVDRGQYWVVLKPYSRYSKLSEIRALTSGLSFCRAGASAQQNARTR